MAEVPSPKTFRPHREVFPAGTSYETAVALTKDIPVAGASRFRLRILTSEGTPVDGTLSLAFLRPDLATPYAANNPANVTVTSGTETKMDVDPHYGAALARGTWTPAADG